MTEPREAPYGEWRSPVTAELIVSETVRLGGIAADGADLYWLEGRPSEDGRNVLVRRRPDGETRDLTPAPFNVRTRVHEYGGGAFLVDRGEVWFCNFDDQRLYCQAPGKAPRALTPEGPHRYADLRLDRARKRILCVREDHSSAGAEPSNELVALSIVDGASAVLASGEDFYSNPTLSPDGSKLAWLSWNHPDMPWDATRLWLADLDGGGMPVAPRCIAGGGGVSVFQPAFSPAGELYLVADPDGWWNLYRWQEGRLQCLRRCEAEFGRPQWVFGLSTYAFLPSGDVACTWCRDGVWRLGRIHPAGDEPSLADVPLTEIDSLVASGDHVALIGGSATSPTTVWLFDFDSGECNALRTSCAMDVDSAFFSAPEAVQFPTRDGGTAHGLFYAPTNPCFRAPNGERPPLIVMSHGGPTGAAGSTLNPRIQYWTSRGLAVLDVNYRGSTGYGRAYREHLNGRWGVVDVEDCVAGARFLADRGRVDEQRLIIRGGSAGGYTTLAALTFHDAFKAGASHYGISDLEALVRDTHKFESRYLDRLVGPYPQRRDLYRERSPIHHVDGLSCPAIFFQGLEDRVVPPNQAQMMVEALRAKGVPVAYLEFPGEQHGFRRSENIKRTFEAELYFYARVFGFTPADELDPVAIDNL